MHLTTTARRAAAASAATALAALITVTPAHARQDPGQLMSDQGTNLTSGSDGSVLDSATTSLTVDDGAVEYLQVALGAIGGIVVAGAVAAGATRRHAYPA